MPAGSASRVGIAAPHRRLAAWIGSILSAALTLAPASRSLATASKPEPEIVRPGIYLSDSVELLLQSDGTFQLVELGGSRRAQGQYKIGPAKLVFSSGRGDIGKTRFPLTCELAGIFGGFVVRSGQAACRPFAGLSFRSAN